MFVLFGAARNQVGVFNGAIYGAIIGGVIGLIVAIVMKARRRRN